MLMAMLGGSFNPVHNGHLFIADAAHRELGYDCVLFVPANRPSHKEFSEDPGADHRLAMVRLVAQLHPFIRVDDCEIRRGGVSYTIDTVRYLESRYLLTDRLGLIVGDDLLAGFSSWRDVDELLDHVQVIVAHRAFEKDVSFCYPHTYLPNRPLPVSSTRIREMLRNGNDAGTLVPSSVMSYIRENALYERG